MDRLPRWAGAIGRFLVVIALTYLGLLAVTFFIGRVIPIDPVLAIVGDRAPEHVVQRVREELGLNKPLWEQFAIYVGNRGEFTLLIAADVKDEAAARKATADVFAAIKGALTAFNTLGGDKKDASIAAASRRIAAP